MTGIASIPAILYRGDSDRQNIRQLRTSLKQRQLYSNLLNGGNGRIIFENPLLNLVQEHVHPGWSRTHFLSFSSEKLSACRFGIGCKSDEDVPAKLQEFEEHYEDDDEWYFAIIEFHTSIAKWIQVGDGIFAGEFEPILNKYKILGSSTRILLIDVATALQARHPEMKQAIANGTRDKEWLLLPATPEQFNNGVEFSAIFDCAIIERITKYRRVSPEIRQ